MEQFINKLQGDFPALTFKKADRASWSPAENIVTYTASKSNILTATWTMLHELGHAIANHTTYDSDINLLRKEIEAWEKAVFLAQKYAITIDEDYIEDCLDTYRDWLHKRSSCPTCETHGLQHSKNLYSCFNCQSTWHVSSERLCRPYRLKKA